MEQLASAEADLLEVQGDRDTDAKLKQQVKMALKKLKATRPNVKKQFFKIDKLLEKGPLSKQAAEKIGIGPAQLNNLKPPTIVDKVWKMVGSHYGAGAKSADSFLEAVASYNTGNSTSPKIVARANGLYNLLNIAGYQRDENLK